MSIVRTVENIMRQYDCDAETAQRYCDLRDEGHQQYQAQVMAGLRDPVEAEDHTCRTCRSTGFEPRGDRCSFCTGEEGGAHCSLGMGCDEAGVCYADAHGDPSQCGRK